MEYYAIYSPSAVEEQDYHPEDFVFENKSDLLAKLKPFKDARFKSFKTYAEALRFAEIGFPLLQQQTSSMIESIKSPPPNLPPIRNMEKSNFPSLKSQDLVIFRKAIESNNWVRVHELISTNPRYLVSSGDTPSILKEGPRYNALHVAAINKHDKIVKLILQTIEQTKFVEDLHGISNHPNTVEMTQFLLESYLNTPDKARNETPLHFAAKFGAVDVVKVLLTYPACKMTQNFEGKLPKDIVCSRMLEGPSKADTKREIEEAFEEKFFVPVFRSHDNSTQPIIGEPFTAANIPNLKTDPRSPSLEIKAYAGPMSMDQAQTFRRRWKTPPRLTPTTVVPLNLNLSFSPKSPRSSRAISEVVSSTPKLKKKLFSDNTSQDRSGCESIMDELNGNHQDISTSILNEHEKEEFKDLFEDLLEDKIQLNSEQSESGGFKANFVGYRNPEPQFETPVRTTKKSSNNNDNNSNHLSQLMEGSLESRYANSFNDTNSMLCNGRSGVSAGFTFLDESGSVYNSDNVCDSPSFKERHTRLADPDKGVETIGRQLAKDYNVEWREYWDFLNKHIDIQTSDGLLCFESYLKQKEKQSELCETSISACDESPVKKALNDSLGLGAICAGFGSLNLTDEKPKPIRNGLMSPSTNISKAALINSFSSSPQSFPLQNPFMCIEQSCRTFSRRLASHLESETVQDLSSYEKILLKEINKLNISIDSYKRDQRFNVVNFQKIHARYCYLLVSYLKENNVNVKYLRAYTPLMSKVYALATQFTDCNEPKESSKVHATCLSKYLKSYIERQDKVFSANNVDTETSCVDAWNGPEIVECSCHFDGFTSSKHRREIRKKLYNDISSSISANAFDMWSFRITTNDTIKSISDDEEEDEAFESCSDDDSDEYFTPPQSPPPVDSDDEEKNVFEESLDKFEDQKEFCLFIKGEKPTKSDDDVFNALGFDFTVDESKYPLVFRWYQTMKVIKTKKIVNNSFHLRIFSPKLKFVS